MRFSTIIATGISAAAVLAVPVEKRALTTDWVVEVVTLTTTVYGAPSPAATIASPPAALQQGGWGGRQSHSHSRRPQSSTSQAQASSSDAPVVVAPTPTPTPSSAPVETSAPADTPTTATTQPSAPVQTGTPVAGACTPWTSPTDFGDENAFVSCGVKMIDTINKYRSAYGKSPLKWDGDMAEAAWATVVFNKGGVTGVHPGLIKGSMGETVTPGFWETGDLKTEGDTPFEVAVVNWLCEVNTDSQLQASGFTGIDQCKISYDVASMRLSGTGHHDIFLADYSYIGCAWMPNANYDGVWPQFAGQWACDYK